MHGLIKRRLKNALLTFAVTSSIWGAHERVLSSTTPRLFTVFSYLTSLPFGKVMPGWSRQLKSFKAWDDPKMMAAVLVELSHR